MILGVSKYGVKVASLDQCVSRAAVSVKAVQTKGLTGSPDQDVLHRHPLYLIVRMLCYDDGLGAGKNLLALKTTDAQQEECSIWVYQCSSSVRGNPPARGPGGVASPWKTVFVSSFFFSGAGSVHLQGAVGFLRLRSVLGQVLMVGLTEETDETAANASPTSQKQSEFASMAPFYLGFDIKR